MALLDLSATVRFACFFSGPAGAPMVVVISDISPVKKEKRMPYFTRKRVKSYTRLLSECMIDSSSSARYNFRGTALEEGVWVQVRVRLRERERNRTVVSRLRANAPSCMRDATVFYLSPSLPVTASVSYHHLLPLFSPDSLSVTLFPTIGLRCRSCTARVHLRTTSNLGINHRRG